MTTKDQSARLKGITRRQFNQLASASAGSLLLGINGSQIALGEAAESRRSQVARHKVVLRSVDIHSPVSVGNGELAFTVDVTGLQSFSLEYRRGMGLATMSQWGFHTTPSPEDYTLEEFPWTMSDSNGREVPYLFWEKGVSPPEWGRAANYLYSVPGRLNLGRIAMVLKTAKGDTARLADLTDIRQELDLWTGLITSEFRFDEEVVHTETSCHPELGQISVRIASPLVARGQLTVSLAFPYGPGYANGDGPLYLFPSFRGDGADWDHPLAHHTVLTRTGTSRANFARTLDSDHYSAALQWSNGCSLAQTGMHEFLLSAERGTQGMEFVVAFAPSKLPATLPNATQTKRAAATMWENFWMTGGSIDLSSSQDPRWHELDRRIVLSQYLTRIQSCGSLPPQETGLTCNSYFGKFHMEMHWAHAAHFTLWGRSHLLERSLGFYPHILPKAQALARKQGYEGARWPKCVGPEGVLKPNDLEPFLIWQQPHPITYSELCYRAHPNRGTLLRYQEVVFETARFLASFAAWIPEKQQYRLGPPVVGANERNVHEHNHMWNPTFEIAYWRYGLETAQRWRERLDLPRVHKWDHVIAHLPPLPTRDGVYVAGETIPDFVGDMSVASLGMLNGESADRKIIRRTLGRLMEQDIFTKSDGTGWAYGVTALTAARLGEPELAVEWLLADKRYLPNGHNQGFHTHPCYLPGNGALLYAAAFMAAGWEGAPKRPAPGFPDGPSWVVRSNGLLVAP